MSIYATWVMAGLNAPSVPAAGLAKWAGTEASGGESEAAVEGS
jgi:hypothetical protein